MYGFYTSFLYNNKTYKIIYNRTACKTKDYEKYTYTILDYTILDVYDKNLTLSFFQMILNDGRYKFFDVAPSIFPNTLILDGRL